MTLLPFIVLVISFCSLWIYRNPIVWGSLLGASLVFGFIAGNITLIGISFLAFFIVLWLFYDNKPNLVLFFLIISVSTFFKMKLIPGFIPLSFTTKFSIGLGVSLIGFFPLALIVPLAKTKKDWKQSFIGFLFGCGGIAVIAILATVTGATNLQFKLPSNGIARILCNLFLSSLPEEGFYRGFVQNIFCEYFAEIKFGKILSLFLTSILFTAAHIYWSQSFEILVFIFIASLLYGGVYLISGKIESSILCHFLLNFTHMTFFSYHAM